MRCPRGGLEPSYARLSACVQARTRGRDGCSESVANSTGVASRIETLDDVAILLGDGLPAQLERRCQLATLDGEFVGDQRKPLHGLHARQALIHPIDLLLEIGVK